jgi:hypothetical protein
MMRTSKHEVRLTVFVNCGNEETADSIRSAGGKFEEVVFVNSEDKANVVIFDRNRKVSPDPKKNINTWYYYVANKKSHVPPFLVNVWILLEEEISEVPFLVEFFYKLIEQAERSVAFF